MRAWPDITHILSIARHGVRIGPKRRGRGPQNRFLPPMRLGMAIGKRENSVSLAVQSSRSGEITLRIGDGDFKRRVTNAERFHIHKHKQLRRPAKFRSAFVEGYRRDGGILL